MREKYAEFVQITGISDLVLEKVLDFIYAGSVSVTADTVCDLLEGAEYAQVDGELIMKRETCAVVLFYGDYVFPWNK